MGVGRDHLTAGEKIEKKGKQKRSGRKGKKGKRRKKSERGGLSDVYRSLTLRGVKILQDCS